MKKAGYTNWHSCGCWAGSVMWRAGAVGGARYSTAKTGKTGKTARKILKMQTGDLRTNQPTNGWTNQPTDRWTNSVTYSRIAGN